MEKHRQFESLYFSTSQEQEALLRKELSAERDRQLEVVVERLSREHVERQVAAEAANNAKVEEARASAGKCLFFLLVSFLVFITIFPFYFHHHHTSIFSDSFLTKPLERGEQVKKP